jgi:hypothetical protein
MRLGENLKSKKKTSYGSRGLGVCVWREGSAVRMGEGSGAGPGRGVRRERK